jgi:hypothetical protein
MSDQQAPATLARQEPAAAPAKSLIADLARAAGVDATKFYDAVKVAAGCKGAQDAHFMVLLMQAEKYGLDPLSSPPQLQLLDVGQGPQVYARLDAYKSFLHRAEASGKIEWRKYEEGWFLDPQHPPEKNVTARGGRVTMKLRGTPEPVVKTVWLREWNGKGQWTNRTSHMLEGRAWKEACRDWLGFFVYDEDDAENVRQGVKTVAVETRDAAPTGSAEPVVPIVGVRRRTVDVAPLDLEPQREPPSPVRDGDNRTAADERHLAGAAPDPAQGKPTAEDEAASYPPNPSPVDRGGATASPALPDPASEEGKRLARELDNDGLLPLE